MLFILAYHRPQSPDPPSFLYFIFYKALCFVPISYHNSWNISTVSLFHFPKFPLLSCSDGNVAVFRGHCQSSSLFLFFFLSVLLPLGLDMDRCPAYTLLFPFRTFTFFASFPKTQSSVYTINYCDRTTTGIILSWFYHWLIVVYYYCLNLVI